jgi:hypothetical protein
MLVGHVSDDFLHTTEIIWKMSANLVVGGSMVFVTIEKLHQVRQELSLLSFAYAFDLDDSLVCHHISKGIDCEIRVQIDAKIPEFFGQFLVVLERLRNWGGRKSHYDGKAVLFL